MKRAQSREGGKIQASNKPEWLSEYGRRELEELVCESTLGGCGHTFHMHGSVEVTIPASGGNPERHINHVYCGACNTRADKYVEALRCERALAHKRHPNRPPQEITASELLRIRHMNSCHEFVTGVVTHVDFEKLFRDIANGKDAFGERKSKPRISKDEKRTAKQRALDLIHKPRDIQDESDGDTTT